MRIRLLSAAVLLALLVASLASRGGTTEPSPVSAELHARAAARGTARVIVRLNAPFSPEAQLASPAHVMSQRQMLAGLQSTVRNQLRGVQHRVVRDFGGSLPLMAIEASPDALRMLESLRGIVVDVQEDELAAPGLAQSVPLINADDVWNMGADGTGQIVAILDTGVQKSHPFFSAGGGKVIAEACFSSTGFGGTSACPGGVETSFAPGSGLPCTGGGTSCNHGTHVAGIAAGSGPSFSGVAKGAQIIAIQVFSRFASEADCGARRAPCALSFSSDQIEALNYVNAQRQIFPGRRIAAVNMSLGGSAVTATCPSDMRALVIDQLRTPHPTDPTDPGVATVISAGNDSFADAIATPACNPAAIPVASSDKSDVISFFSNMASPTIFPNLLIAPGTNITSSYPTSIFFTLSGTSMSAPHVTGTFAVLRQIAPTATVDQLLTLLKATGHPITDHRVFGGSTAPRIDVLAAALQFPANLVVQTLTAPATAPPGASISVSTSIRNTAIVSANASTLNLYLSTDKLITAGDTLLGTIAFPALTGGSTSAPATQMVQIPSATFPGTYFIGAIADADGQNAENTEADNTKAVQIQIAQPDLVVPAVTFAPASSGPGLNVSVTHTVSNVALSPSHAPASISGIYLGLNQSFGSVIGGPIATVNVPPVAAGTTTPSLTTSVTIPGGTPVGRYSILVRANDTSAFVEGGSAANNVGGSATQLVIGPDLIVTAASTAAAIATGANVGVTYTVKNQGGQAAGPFDVGFALTPQPSGTDRPVGPNRSVPGLAVGMSLTFTNLVSIPPDTPPLGYKVKVIADANSAVDEADESNNTLLTGAINVVQSDLTVSAVTFTPAATRPGGNLTVTHRVKNVALAPGSASGSLSRLLLTQNQSVLGPPAADLGQVVVPPLAAGGTATVTKVVQIPSGEPFGVYYVAASADDGDAVFELHEDNNAGFSLTRLIVGPDLLPTAASTVAAAAPGMNVSITYTIKNQGGLPADFSAAFSLEPQPSGTPIFIGGNGATIPSLAPGASKALTSQATIPSNTPPGPYKVSVLANNPGGDADPSNNSRLTGVLNINRPDLAMQSVTFSPASVAPGGNVTVMQTVKNLGLPPAGVSTTTSRLFLSLNQSIPTVDLALVSVPPIAAGATVTASNKVTIPGGTAPGLYYVVADANFMEFVFEARDDNNLGASLTRLIVGPDILPTAATTVGTIAPGRNLSVSYTLKNQGGAATGPFDVDFAIAPVNASGTPIGGEVSLGTRPAASILPGGTLVQNSTFVVPSFASGLHRIRITVDPANAVIEADEGNNTRLTTGNLNVVPPDLSVPPFTFSPAVSAPNGAVTVLYSVKNQAPAPGDAAASASRLFLSLNQTVLGEVVNFGTVSVPPIAAGMTVSGTRPITLPGNLSAGYYYFGTVADPNGQVFESNEANNVGFTQTRLLVGPDILPTAATTTSRTTPGTNVSVLYTLKNQGGQAAGNFSVSFALVPVTAAGVATGADISLAPTRTGVTLAAGAMQSATSGVAIPAVPTPGLYRIRVIADSDNTVSEADETNNTLLTTGVISVVRPDLAVQSVTATPAVATTGTNLSVSHVVKNLAGAPGAAGPTTTRFFLTAPTGPAAVAPASGPVPPATIFSVDVPVPAIPAGGMATVGTKLTVPSLSPGKYFVVARANALSSIVESDSPTQANDERSTAAAIIIGPDLTVTAATATPLTLALGANVSVMNTVKNQGGGAAGPFDVGFYLSTSNVFDDSAVLLKTRRVLSLAPGAVSTATTPVTIPSNQSGGTYFVIVRADSAAPEEVTEADETNNTRPTAAISVLRPDLVVLSVAATPGATAPGANISVTHTVKNVSPAAGTAAPTTSRLYLSDSPSPIDVASQPVLGDVSVPALAGGAMATVSKSVPIPVDTVPGKYWVFAVANATGAVLEVSTSNAQRTTTPILVGPDLLMTTLTVPQLVSPNLTFPVTTTVKNQGGQGTNGSVVKFFLSLSGLLDGTEVPVGVTATAALAPAASFTTTSRLMIPGNTSSGGKFLLTQVDAGVPEGDLGNNIRLGNFNVFPPQLQIMSITTPAAAIRGRVTGAPNVSVVLKNVGSAPLTGPAAPFDVQVFANRDDGTPGAQAPGSGDLIFSKTVAALAPGALITVTGPLVIPEMVGPDVRLAGNYFVSATADPTGAATGDPSLGDNALTLDAKPLPVLPDMIKLHTATIPIDLTPACGDTHLNLVGPITFTSQSVANPSTFAGSVALTDPVAMFSVHYSIGGTVRAVDGMGTAGAIASTFTYSAPGVSGTGTITGAAAGLNFTSGTIAGHQTALPACSFAGTIDIVR